MKCNCFAVAVLLAVLPSASAHSQSAIPKQTEQTHFSAEDESVRRPVALPADVLAILHQDRLVQNVLKYSDPPVQEMPSSWFTASIIHLHDPRQDDLVVEANGPLAGGNVVTFWVFVHTPHGYSLVLTAPAHDLEVRKDRWKGYREIEISGETAAEFTSIVFRWEGTHYTEHRERSQKLP